MSTGIIIENLSKSFGSFKAVDDVSFEAQDGKITALLGPSGSGKSTVLRIIAGLERPDSGEIWVEGEEQTRKSVQERQLGFVFQHYALFRHMTVHDNVAFGLSVRKESKAIQRRRVDELLELVGLGPFAGRYPDQLSGGQRQRVALARALAPRPKVLLLDEPFGALDARVRQELRRWLDELHRELGVTSLLVTHDQEEALELANKVVVMHEGRVEQIGTPDDIYNSPKTPFIASFVGASNVIHGRVDEGRFHFAGHAISGAEHLPDGSQAQGYVRHHDVRVLLDDDEGTFPVVVDRISDLGWMAKVRVTLRDGQVLSALIPKDFLAVAPGEKAFALVRNVKVFPSTGSIDDVFEDTMPDPQDTVVTI